MILPKITKIRTKLLLGFFSSIMLITLTSIWTNYLIDRIHKAIDWTLAQQRAVDDIAIRSATINGITLLFDFYINDPEKFSANESELQASMERLHRSLETLKENPKLQEQLKNIENSHQELMFDREKLIVTQKQHFEQERALDGLIEDLRTRRHQIIDNTGRASAKLQLEIAQVGYKDKEFIFQYQDEKHAKEWIETINMVATGLKQEGYNNILVFANVYSDLAEESIKTVSNINDLKLKKLYYQEKIKAVNVELQIDLTVVSNLVKKDLEVVLKQGQLQKWFAYGAIFFSLFLGSLIVLILSGGITKSLGELVRVAKAVSGGRPKERVKILSADELGYLGSTFNQMLDSIEKSQSEITAANQQLRASEQQLKAGNQQLRASEQQLRAANQQLIAATQSLAEERASLEIRVKARTKEITEEQLKLQSLVESLKLGIIMVDLNFNIILANPAAKAIFGKFPGEPLFFQDLEEKLKGIKISQTLSYYVKSSKSSNIQEVIIGDRYFRLFFVPVRNVKKRIFIGAVIVFEDISEEKMVAKMKTEIVSITSHQLRTPLSVIKGNLEMILGGDAGEITKEQREILGEAFLGNERMVKLINFLMDVSKIDEGRFDFGLKPVKLENLITESVNELMPFAEKSKVSLSYKTPPQPLPKVNIDSQRIKQVLQNLIDNAIKYSVSDSRGRVMVKVQKDKGGKFLKITVKDNGAGIPKDEQKQTFQRFFRASNAGKLDPGGGTGLGLFIVKTIIDGHGGKIWFKSGGKGKGATFYFTLPTIKQKKNRAEN